MDYFKLHRDYWDWAFNNPDLCTPTTAAVYSFAIENWNRLGHPDKFRLGSEMTATAVGVKYKAYKKALDILVDNGFITYVQKSKNQYSANIICLGQKGQSTSKALDKAMNKQGQSTGQSMSKAQTTSKDLNTLRLKDLKSTQNLENEILEVDLEQSMLDDQINLERVRMQNSYLVSDENFFKVLKKYCFAAIRDGHENRKLRQHWAGFSAYLLSWSSDNPKESGEPGANTKDLEMAATYSEDQKYLQT